MHTYLPLNNEFNRIPIFAERNAREERLVEGDSFICNAKVHSVQDKREVSACRVHHNANTVSCANMLTIPSIIFVFVIVRGSRP